MGLVVGFLVEGLDYLDSDLGFGLGYRLCFGLN